MTENHIGKSIFVSAALPATNNAAGFESLTWAEAKGIQQVPQLGITHNMIDVPDLKSGFTESIKGAGKGVGSQGTWRFIDSDAGQVILKAQANGQTGLLSIKVVKGTGTDNAPATGDAVQYAQGIGHSYAENPGTDTTHEGFTVGFQQNALTIDATEPA